MNTATKSRMAPPTAWKPSNANLLFFASGDLAETLSEDRRRVLRERLERDEKTAQQEAAAPSTPNGEQRQSVPWSMSAYRITKICCVRCVYRERCAKDKVLLFAELAAAFLWVSELERVGIAYAQPASSVLVVCRFALAALNFVPHATLRRALSFLATLPERLTASPRSNHLPPREPPFVPCSYGVMGWAEWVQRYCRRS